MEEVIAVFASQVPDEREAALRDAFIENTAGPLPEGEREIRLLRSPNVPGQWAIISRWRTEEDLDRYRREYDPPREVLAFRGAQIEPSETIYEVIRDERQHGAAPRGG